MTDQVEQTAEQIEVESGAAFAKGFDTMRGSPPVEVKPEVKAEEPKEVVPEVKAAEPDPWAGVPLAVKAELESISGKLKSVDDLDHRFKSYEGRVHKMGSAIEALATAKAAAATVDDAPTAAQIESSAASSAKWKQLKEDFPDWVEAMDSRLAEVQAAIPKAPKEVDVSGLKAEIGDELTKSLQPILKEVAALARQQARVDAKYPEWEKTINTPEFGTWMESQAPEVKALGASSNATDAIQMLDAYEVSRKKTEAAERSKAANDARLKSAITPKGVPNASPTTLNDTDAFERGFKKASA